MSKVKGFALKNQDFSYLNSREFSKYPLPPSTDFLPKLKDFSLKLKILEILLCWFYCGNSIAVESDKKAYHTHKYIYHSVIFCVEIKLESLGMTLLYLESLRKRCLNLCVTWWGVTTHQASTGRGAGQPLPTPLPVLAWWVVTPHQVTPLFLISFSQRIQK